MNFIRKLNGEKEACKTCTFLTYMLCIPYKLLYITTCIKKIRIKGKEKGETLVAICLSSKKLTEDLVGS